MTLSILCFRELGSRDPGRPNRGDRRRCKARIGGPSGDETADLLHHVSQLFAGRLRLCRASSDAEPTRNVIPSIEPAPIPAFRQSKPLVRTTKLCGVAELACVTRAASIVSGEGPTTTAAEWLRR